jgi:pimeloyl-ACP methyl ester carboxylesterase
MPPDDYGDVLEVDWQTEIVRDHHPRDKSRVFTVADDVADAAAAAGSGAGSYSPEPVMLLHGVGNNGAIFAPVMSSLARLGPVVAPTMSPGLLGDDIDDVDDRDGAVSRLVDWLAEVAPPPWRVIGHSMGGVLAGMIVRARPEVVSRAVLLNAPLPGTVARLRSGDTLDRNGRALLAMKGLARITSYGRPRLPRWLQGTELAIVRTALGGFVKHPGRLDGEIISGAILRSRTTDGIDFLRLARELPTWESEPHHGHAIEIIVGDDDPLVPLSDHEALADAYPAATLHVADECGHFVHLERPQLTIDAITDFFASSIAA